MTIIKFNKLLILLTALIMCSYSYAGNWLQADLQYNQRIDGKDYLAKVTLLRPESYFTENKAIKAGAKLTVDLPEMGLNNVAMKIMAIKPFKGILIKESETIAYKSIDEVSWDNRTNRPVTGTFARYAKEVYTYKFKNSKTGEISIINATPNHPFYVVNKHDYIPIAKVTAGDELLSQAGEKVKLLCNYDNQSNCGTRYNTDNKPTMVYNFEVYQKHRYFVGHHSGKQNLLVHNPCFKREPIGNINDWDSRLIATDEIQTTKDRKLAYSRIRNDLSAKLVRIDTRDIEQIKKTGGFTPHRMLPDHVYSGSVSTSIKQSTDSIVAAYEASLIEGKAFVYKIDPYGKRVITFDGLTEDQVASIGGPHDYKTTQEVQVLDTIEMSRITLIGYIEYSRNKLQYTPLKKSFFGLW